MCLYSGLGCVITIQQPEMKKAIFNLIIITLLSSCDSMFKPFPLNFTVPDGPPEYRAGWHDGCSSALTASAAFMATRLNDFTMGSGIYQHDPAYQNAWSSGWFSCVTSVGAFGGFPGTDAAPWD